MEDLQALEVALDERDAADDSARSTLQQLRAHCIIAPGLLVLSLDKPSTGDRWDLVGVVLGFSWGCVGDLKGFWWCGSQVEALAFQAVSWGVLMK